MSFPAVFPDWVPWWVPLVVLLPALLYALAFLFMPFSVIGLKSRLDVLEARLDEIQNEIRHLSLRLPAPARPMDFDEGYIAQPPTPTRAAEATMSRPPIPPAPQDLRQHRDYAEARPAPVPRSGKHDGARSSAPSAARDQAEDADHPAIRPPRSGAGRAPLPPLPPAPEELDEDGDYPEDRPPPPPDARPVRGRTEPQTPRPPRAEPRLHWPR
jgi:hypothetical protein